jgi:hypothetical protein
MDLLRYSYGAIDSFPSQIYPILSLLKLNEHREDPQKIEVPAKATSIQFEHPYE